MDPTPLSPRSCHIPPHFSALSLLTIFLPSWSITNSNFLLCNRCPFWSVSFFFNLPIPPTYSIIDDSIHPFPSSSSRPPSPSSIFNQSPLIFTSSQSGAFNFPSPFNTDFFFQSGIVKLVFAKTGHQKGSKRAIWSRGERERDKGGNAQGHSEGG